MTKTTKKPGDRSWSPEQRAKQAEYMRKLHAEKRKLMSTEQSYGLPSEKASAIDNLTVGVLISRLQKLMSVGATEDTPVTILGIDSPEICPQQRFDQHGELTVEVVLIR